MLFVFSWFCWLLVGSVCFLLVPLVVGRFCLFFVVPLVVGRFCLFFVGSAGCG